MNESIDLAACEHEPITIPGSVQPHGVLLVLRGTSLTVMQASPEAYIERLKRYTKARRMPNPWQPHRLGRD
jgi:light-regulated signal transduction histidine kinase (bacteriophytochrome)